MKYKNIIGRETEIATLERLYKSQKSEFVAIYGRRRIGKSYLVSEVYGKKILFSAVGTYIKDDDKSNETYRQLQLDHFFDSLLLAGLEANTPNLLAGAKRFCCCEDCLKNLAHAAKSSYWTSCLGWQAPNRRK